MIQKFFNFGFIVFVLFAVCSTVKAVETEHVLWKREPVKILLPLGKEKIITFPCSVSVDVKATDFVEMILANGNLYITPKYEFVNKRILLKSDEAEEVFILDLSVSKAANNNRIEIILAEKEALKEESLAGGSVAMVDLVRYAVQQFYGVDRLLQHNPNIYRVAMRIPRVLKLYPEQDITAMPIGQWKGGDLYVTAVYLKNKGENHRSIDLRLIKGNWMASVVFPNMQLFGYKKVKDDTMLFLVSKRSFVDTVGDMLL